MVIGGDSLEENFVLDGSYSSSESETSFEAPLTTPKTLSEPQEDEEVPECENERVVEQQAAKKKKLNWRETASNKSGDAASQREILLTSRTAAAKFFPNFEVPFCGEDLNDLEFVDATEFMAKESKSVRDMLEFLKAQCHALSPERHADGRLRTLVIAGSATRGMYIVKELREMDAKLSPLPLFFHGGGRKKEQARTHESVLKGKKASVAVCLPSRLRSMADEELIDFSTIDLVVFDLKQNEKRLNVMSQKETMMDLLEILGKHIIPKHNSNMKIAMI